MGTKKKAKEVTIRWWRRDRDDTYNGDILLGTRTYGQFFAEEPIGKIWFEISDNEDKCVIAYKQFNQVYKVNIRDKAGNISDSLMKEQGEKLLSKIR